METIEKEILRGGQFLIKESNCEDIFTPETEEHTSELQSHSDLVCRLLLEKKNKNKKKNKIIKKKKKH